MVASTPLRAENPGSTDCAFASVRMNNPADTSSTSDNATCATTGAAPQSPRRGDAVTAPDDSFNADMTDDADACSAGIKPKMNAVTAVTAPAKRRTAPFRVGCTSMGSGAGGTKNCATSLVQYA